MPFEKGHAGGPGRPKGSTNKVTNEIKAAFAEVLENRLPDIDRWIRQVAQEDPKGAVELVIKLSNRFLPELARTELTGKDGHDLFKNIKFEFGPSKENEKTDTE